MFGHVLSALFSAIAFLVRSVIVKFVVYIPLFYITTEFISYLTPYLPNATALNSAFGGITSGVWYFLDVFAFSAGLPLIVSAFITRFIIRRIPVIG